jgi:hypothetical protein
MVAKRGFLSDEGNKPSDGRARRFEKAARVETLVLVEEMVGWAVLVLEKGRGS